MKREIVNEILPIKLNWHGKVLLSEIQGDLVKLEGLGATHVDIDFINIKITAINERFETNEEAISRRRELFKEEHELYLKLKAKFG